MNISIKRLGNLIGTITCGIITYTTAQGSFQEVVHFAGIANEIAFFLMASTLTVIFSYLTISK
jgi:hypothetical protein